MKMIPLSGCVEAHFQVDKAELIPSLGLLFLKVGIKKI